MAIDDYPADEFGELSLDQPIFASFNFGNDIDYFAIELDAGTSYLFDLQAANGGYVPFTTGYAAYGLAIYNADGDRVGDVVAGGDTEHPVLEYRSGAAGTYYVAAMSNYYWDATGGYRLAASKRAGGDDHGDDVRTDAALSLPGTVAAKFDYAGDRDWFRFQAEVGIHYSFLPVLDGVAGSVYPTRYRIFDADGKLLDLQNYNVFDPKASGAYFLEVLGLTAGNYALKTQTWVDDFTGHNARPGLVAPGAQLSGTIQYEGDVDRFKMHLEADRFYLIEVAAAEHYMSMRLADADGKLVADMAVIVRGEMGFYYQPAVSGDFYLDIESYSSRNDIIPYTVSVGQPIADDVGNSVTTGEVVTVGQAVIRVLQAVSDRDVFSAALAAGVTYRFSAQALAGSGAEMAFELTRSDGEVFSTTRLADAANFTFTPAQSGNYFAHVSSAAGVVNALYTFSVSTPADDAGASAANAQPIALGTPKTGVLETGGGDRDWFAVDLAAGSTYWFSLDSGSYSLLRSSQIKVFDTVGRELAVGTAPWNAGSNLLPFVAGASGTYFVEASSTDRTSGSYTLSAMVGERDDFGVTPATAGQLAPGAPLLGRLEHARDKDLFKFGVVAGTTYGLDLGYAAVTSSAGQIGLAWAGGGSISSTGMDYTSGHHRVVFTAQVSGEVLVTVDNSYSNAAALDYSLSAMVYGADDVGDSRATAGVVTVGGTFQGALSSPIDTDLVKLTLEAGKTYVLRLLGSASAGGSLDMQSGPRFDIQGLGGGTPSGTVKSGSSREPWLTVKPEIGGDYWLTVSPSRASTTAMGSYTISTLLLPPTDDSLPTLVAQSHGPHADVRITDTMITLNFSEAIVIDRSAVRLVDASGAAVPQGVLPGAWNSAPFASGSTLMFKASDHFAPGNYTILLPQAGIHDLGGNRYTGPESISFSVAAPLEAGTAANDLLLGGTWTHIDGGAGIDTVVYARDKWEYTVSGRADGSTHVSLRNGASGDTLAGVERIVFSDAGIAFDVDGSAGQAYRLYQAAFGRKPDSSGMGYWMSQLDKGVSMHDVAHDFVASNEFKAMYGAAPSNAEFISRLYANVLHRPGDAAGISYWEAALANGYSRDDALVQFSESAENRLALDILIGLGIPYTPY